MFCNGIVWMLKRMFKCGCVIMLVSWNGRIGVW